MSNLPDLPSPFFWKNKRHLNDFCDEQEKAVLCATGTEWCKRHKVPNEALAIVFSTSGNIFVRVWRKGDWHTLPEKFPTVEAAANYAWATVVMGEVDFKILGEVDET